MKMDDLTTKFIVYSNGNIYNKHKGTFIKPSIAKVGYPMVTLRIGKEVCSFLVHRLVAYFNIDNPLNYPVVNHKNAIKTDCNANNLEWCSPQMNFDHAVDMGVSNVTRAVTREEVLQIRSLEYKTITKRYVAECFQINYYTLMNIVHYKNYKNVA